ncbi:MAG: hypothetical protein GY827_07420 [Cytophagales bacterium]|nr:hypothetical protein [Cytophagales bacterium]
MKEKITLNYDCPQQWDNMQKIENSNNRICGKCQMELTDFSKMSTKEIQDYFKTGKATQGCGKFYNHQLQNTKKSFIEKSLLKTEAFFEKRNFLFKSSILWLLGGMFFLSGCYKKQYTAGTYTFEQVEHNQNTDIKDQ